MNCTFDTFREAGQYASRFCVEHNTSASIIRLDGNKWLVVPPDDYLARKKREEEERQLAEQSRQADERAREEARRREEKELARLKEREKYYEGLSTDALTALWDHHNEPTISPRELDTIRSELRKRLGIKPAPPPPTACPTCLQIPCTCFERDSYWSSTDR